MKGNLTRQQAINAHCKECVYDSVAGLGTWREQVKDCKGYKCHLYPYRPMPAGSNEQPQTDTKEGADGEN